MIRLPGRRLRTCGVLGVLAVGGAALAACQDLGPTDREDGAGLTPMEFVDVVVAIRKAEQEARYEDSAAVVFDRLKAGILEERGVTEEEIREFVHIHSGDFDVMAEVWDSITQRLKYEPRPHDPSAEGPPIDSL